MLMRGSGMAGGAPGLWVLGIGDAALADTPLPGPTLYVDQILSVTPFVAVLMQANATREGRCHPPARSAGTSNLSLVSDASKAANSRRNRLSTGFGLRAPMSRAAKLKANAAMADFLVAALYRFVDFPDFENWREPLLGLCRAQAVKGTLLLAKEGINGTIAGSESGVQSVLDRLRADPRFADLQPKFSWANEALFHRMKVRLKKEIVTMGFEGIDPNQLVGTYVDPQDWNALIQDPNVTVIDTRNDYEVAIGTFAGARNPNLGSFRDFPAWLKTEVKDGQKVAMFCTGGIRCEKSTAYLKQLGVREVFHLEGGILNYLETVPEDKSLWEGQCFVFDERVAVGHGLAEGTYSLCRACRFPIEATAQTRAEFEAGVSCHHCYEKTSEVQKASCRERMKQVELAEARGQQHLGNLDS